MASLPEYQREEGLAVDKPRWWYGIILPPGTIGIGTATDTEYTIVRFMYERNGFLVYEIQYHDRMSTVQSIRSEVAFRLVILKYLPSFSDGI